ncbi:aldo/keto reductase [Thomasclavelia sp.]|uniref:aldo/keto reductase n=1 Tax=Thomasclavelia sp. TaxID=3025757 RepID=UPI0025FCB651|nr:aldo/keto reductase [Thomasclavelia sp.]
MKTRILGNGLTVSAFGLGCMTMINKDEQDMIELIREAVNLGINFFDTAEIYGPYFDEILVGKALKPIRDQVIIASKCGLKMVDGKQVVDGNLAGIRKSLEGSLQRLQTDHIDLYYLHRVDPNVPIEQVANLMKSFIEEGKIRYWGLSEPGIETIKRAHAICPLTAIESEYSMMWRQPEKELLDLLEQLNIGLVPFAPLCKGFLTNGFDKQKYQNGVPRFLETSLKKNQALIDVIDELANNKNVTRAQIALAWLLTKKEYIVPIPGTTRLERLKENIQAVDLKFSEKEWETLNQALDSLELVNGRYIPGSDFEKRVGR